MRSLPIALVLLAGCSGRQSALDPAGRHAADIAGLWWIFLAVTAAVWLLVVVFLLIASFRRNRIETSERNLLRSVVVATGATVVILFILLFASITTGNALVRTSDRAPIKIQVTGQQWWWAVDYKSEVPSENFTTANEIYVPVGHPIEVVLDSRDVIHSFWIPNVHGKRDLIPGDRTQFVMQVDRAGTYEGQCAEFCGQQHAKMRLSLRAVPLPEYAQWAERQRRPARPPSNRVEARGQEVFLAGSCPMCHTIKGTPAGGKRAPDLTHVGSRRMLAANSIPNSVGHMAGWITDPQSVKPGVHMPPNTLPPADLQALLAYLRSLR